MLAEGFIASGATPWLALFSFLVALGYSATSGGLSKEVRTLAGLSLPTSATLGAESVLELLRPDAWMAKG